MTKTEEEQEVTVYLAGSTKGRKSVYQKIIIVISNAKVVNSVPTFVRDLEDVKL